MNPAAMINEKNIPEFYSAPCRHIEYAKNLFRIFNLAIESYEFNCRDSWICKKCNVRVDPFVLLERDNYDIK